MNIETDQIYHVYNRGNNRQQIFFERENYFYFIEKIEKYISPCCEIMAYCLMPNHFHFLIYATEKTTALYRPPHNTPRLHRNLGNFTELSNGIKLLLSSYTKAINKRYGRTGSLFSQNTKVKSVSSANGKTDYSYLCFRYIHNNPVRANLVSKPEIWEFSSYRDYLFNTEETICNRELTISELALELYDERYLQATDFTPELVSQFY